LFCAAWCQKPTERRAVFDHFIGPAARGNPTLDPHFAVITGPKCADGNGGRRMASIEFLRKRAEEYLEKARRVSERQKARLLLVQAHNYLKHAEEQEAQELSARR
jgi:hypothetical protein